MIFVCEFFTLRSNIRRLNKGFEVNNPISIGLKTAPLIFVFCLRLSNSVALDFCSVICCLPTVQ